MILISVDTLRADALSSYGSSRPTTPSMDHLATRGVRFATALAPSPWTVPSHASMFTSLMPAVIGADGQHPLAPEFVTLAEHLREHGFVTGAIVNALYMSERFGFEQGFDEFIFMRRVKDVEANVDRALAFLDEHAADPTFLFLHVFDAHAPYEPPTPYDRLYVEGAFEPDGNIPFLRQIHYHDYLDQLDDAPSVAYLRAKYDAGVARVDEQIGRFLAGLRERRRFEDALIILTSDHGEAFFEHGIWVGHGLFLYETELRIPLIVKLPGGVHAGAVVDEPVGLLDVAPTVTRIAGVPGLPQAQGRSLVPGEERAAGTVFGSSSNTGDTYYVRTGRWKYVEPMVDPLPQVFRRHLRPNVPSRRQLEQRIVVGAQLYDLRVDPEELHNLAEAEVEVTATLAGLVAARRAEDERLRAVFREEGQRLELTPGERERLRSLGYAD